MGKQAGKSVPANQALLNLRWKAGEYAAPPPPSVIRDSAWVNTVLAASPVPVQSPFTRPFHTALSLFPLKTGRLCLAGTGKSDDAQPKDGSCMGGSRWHRHNTNKHTELTPGAPGLGKSVLINALSEIQIASAQKNLPFIAYIDKGFSAQGTGTAYP